MKLLTALLMGVLVSGCAHFGNTPKRPVETVASCFGDEDDQSLYCKSKREDQEGKVVTTRCIGTKNQQSDPKLRGKCVEKTCTAGSNTDCQTRGVIAVLDQYTELTTAQLFNADEAARNAEAEASSAAAKEVAGSSAKEVAATASKENAKDSGRGERKTAKQELKTGEPAPTTIRMVSVSKPKKSAEKAAAEEASTGEDSMQLVLKPAKKARGEGRKIASVSAAPLNGMKKFCVARTEVAAPKHLRGKCATRTCSKGKCAYTGRKEVVDWAAQSISANTN